MNLTADCVTCSTLIYWIECPTGNWWSHQQHPADEHDAHPVNCPRCKNTGIDPEFSYPAIVTPGEEEPGSIEPCTACQLTSVEEAS